LKRGSLYRSDVEEAVRIFRPVLQGLKIRNENGHPIVYFAQFDGLRHLHLDECSVKVQVENIDTFGVFVIKYTQTGLLRAYIILSRKLYNNSTKTMKEVRKIAGVHEFVHFIAVVYVATVIETEPLRSKLLERLQHTVKKLPGPDLLVLYNALTGEAQTKLPPVELTDSHFRLGYEGPTPDYNLLFLHFMFSKKLFEEYFNTEKQTRFRQLIDDDDNIAASLLLVEVLEEAARDKSVPLKTAISQVLGWTHIYIRDTATS
jgi:hypothetical protein